MRSLLEILERVDQANGQGHLKVIASSCVLSLLVHSRSNAMYVNRYNGSMGASGTAVVANAIDIYADDKDVQQLAAPATQQLFKTSDNLTVGNMEKPQRGANRRSRPSTAHSTSRRRHDRRWSSRSCWLRTLSGEPLVSEASKASRWVQATAKSSPFLWKREIAADRPSCESAGAPV